MPSIPDVIPPTITVTNPLVPALATIDVVIPTFTGTLPIIGDIDVLVEDPPAFNIPMPSFQIPPVPSLPWPTFNKTAPTIVKPAIPTKPAISLPPVPTLLDVSVPSPPSIDFPSFEGVLPAIDLAPPVISPVFAEDIYSSQLLDALGAKLLTDIVAGGSGLGAATEQAIYDRATARQELEHNQMYSEAENYFASRGFSIPPGALASRLLEANYKINQTRTDLNNDILVQQSKLAQENTQFTVKASLESETMLVNYKSQQAQRSIVWAQFINEFALRTYEARIEGYKAQLQAYTAQAAVYEAKVRAESIKAEIYRTQIEAARLTVEMNQAVVNVYEAQVRSLSVLIQLYATEMEAARIQAEIEKLSIDIFRAEVDAYTAEIGAVVARINAYEAQIRGETAKAQMYLHQVQGYAAQVEAYKSKADVQMTEAQIKISKFQGEIDGYKAELALHTELIRGAVAEAEIISKEQGYTTDLYQAQIARYDAEVRAAVGIYEGEVQEVRNIVELWIKEYDVELRNLAALTQIASEETRAAAAVEAQIAAATLGQQSWAWTDTISHSWAVVDSTSNNTNQNFGSQTIQTFDQTAWVEKRYFTEQHIYMES